MTEEWRPVVGYEGIYEVSDQGQVRSLNRRITDTLGRTKLYKGKLLKTTSSSTPPYPSVYLGLGGKDATPGQVRVHVILMAAFVGPRPAGMLIRHLDGNHLNCRLSNLAYGTVSDNAYDRVRHGHHPAALQTHCKRGHEFTSERSFLVQTVSTGRTRLMTLRSLLRNYIRVEQWDVTA